MQKITRGVLVATLIAVAGGLTLRGLSNDTTADLVKNAPAVTAPAEGGTATEYVTESTDAPAGAPVRTSSSAPTTTATPTTAVQAPPPASSTHFATTVTITRRHTDMTTSTRPTVDKDGDPLS